MKNGFFQKSQERFYIFLRYSPRILDDVKSFVVKFCVANLTLTWYANTFSFMLRHSFVIFILSILNRKRTQYNAIKYISPGGI